MEKCKICHNTMKETKYYFVCPYCKKRIKKIKKNEI